MHDSFKPDEADPEAKEPERAEGTLVPRILGFDVGDRRIGLAISDPLGYTAQPLFTLHRAGKKADLKSVGRVLRKHGVREMVVGNPLLYVRGPEPAGGQGAGIRRGAAHGVRRHGASVG